MMRGGGGRVRRRRDAKVVTIQASPPTGAHMATRKIAVVVGSLRKESYTRTVAKTLMLLAPPTLEMEMVEIGQLPLYNQDDDAGNPPPTYTEFRNRIREADGVLFCTPEYNRSVPGCLKNAIDVGSRPYGQSAWNGKPCAVVSVSPGAIGGFGANHHLRQSLVFLNMPCMQGPEAYVGGIANKLDGDKLSDDSTRSFLQNFIDGFNTWVERHAD
jgi:chromate reductase